MEMRPASGATQSASKYRSPPPGYQLTMGAMTRWSCGHEATLSRPLEPGVTVATAPCPFCGRQGIAGQYVDGQLVTWRALEGPAHG